MDCAPTPFLIQTAIGVLFSEKDIVHKNKYSEQVGRKSRSEQEERLSMVDRNLASIPLLRFKLRPVRLYFNLQSVVL